MLTRKQNKYQGQQSDKMTLLSLRFKDWVGNWRT